MELNDKAYTIHLDGERKRRGRYRKGNIPWNKGLSWKEQGVSDEERARKLAILKANAHKNGYGGMPTYSKPVIQMDEDGNRLHWYVSSEAAARKVGCQGRNMRRVCTGERGHAGGYRWKWDDRF